MPAYRLTWTFHCELDAPNDAVARQVVLQSVSVSVALTSAARNVGGTLEAVELTPEMLAKEAEQKRQIGRIFRAE